MSILEARQTVAPTADPITRAEAKAHLRVEHSADDTLIDSLIVAVRTHTENEGWLALCTQTWKLYLKEWPKEPIFLPRHPIASISSIKYRDESDAEQTLSNTVYTLVPAAGLFAQLWLKAEQEWPTVTLSSREYPIEIDYVAGFGDASAVPQPIKSYMLLRLGALYENREAVTVAGGGLTVMPFVEGLLEPYRGQMY